MYLWNHYLKIRRCRDALHLLFIIPTVLFTLAYVHYGPTIPTYVLPQFILVALYTS